MGKQWEPVRAFVFLGSKITADGNCSHEIKRCLLLGRKVMTNLDSIFKSKDVTLPAKVRLVKGMVFPCHVWMWELDYKESRAPKNWCFWTVVLEKTLESPLTARRSNESVLKEIGPEYSLEGLMLNLQYFLHLMQSVDSLEKTHVGKDWGQEEKGVTEDEMVGWHHWLNRHEFEQTLGDSEGQGSLVWHAAILEVAELDMTEWTTIFKANQLILIRLSNPP